MLKLIAPLLAAIITLASSSGFAQEVSNTKKITQLSCDQKMHLVNVGIGRNIIVLNGKRIRKKDLGNTLDRELIEYANRIHRKSDFTVVFGAVTVVAVAYSAATTELQNVGFQPFVLIPAVGAAILTGALSTSKRVNLEQYVARYNELKLKELNETP